MAEEFLLQVSLREFVEPNSILVEILSELPPGQKRSRIYVKLGKSEIWDKFLSRKRTVWIKISRISVNNKKSGDQTTFWSLSQSQAKKASISKPKEKVANVPDEYGLIM